MVQHASAVVTNRRFVRKMRERGKGYDRRGSRFIYSLAAPVNCKPLNLAEAGEHAKYVVKMYVQADFFDTRADEDRGAIGSQTAESRKSELGCAWFACGWRELDDELF